jgi:hypothetical protein
MTTREEILEERLSRYRQIKISVIGRSRGGRSRFALGLSLAFAIYFLC